MSMEDQYHADKLAQVGPPMKRCVPIDEVSGGA
jgi:hypothetical protein